MNSLQHQHILILGLGASGLGLARWCVRCGARVTVADTRQNPPQLAVLQSELPMIRFVGGAFTAGLLQGVNAVFKSPGLSPAEIAVIATAAQASGISVSGELTLFAQALAQLASSRGYAPVVLAITGTNAKTTVTSMTGQLVAHAGRTVAVAGNIGPTLLDTLAARLDADDLPQVWVLELSSFQLDSADGFCPTAATVLNLTQDHLDWHGSMAAYAQAKSRIFGHAGLQIRLQVLNRDDPAVMAMQTGAAPGPGTASNTVTFGSDGPQRPGDFGLDVADGVTWLVRATEITTELHGGQASALPLQRLLPTGDLLIRGHHNALNAQAALALATAAGCPPNLTLGGLRAYRGEPHRVQWVNSVCSIDFIDDSKGTNVGATVAALGSVGATCKVVIILGGDGKGQDFGPLAQAVRQFARAAVLIGRDAHLIHAVLADTGVPLRYAQAMDDAVQQAYALAQIGDTVLLSPACASLDMFNDYAHRARMFVQAVHGIAAPGGSS